MTAWQHGLLWGALVCCTVCMSALFGLVTAVMHEERRGISITLSIALVSAVLAFTLMLVTIGATQ